MTWRDVILYGPGWAAGLLLLIGKPLGRWHHRRVCRQYEERWGVPYDGP